MSSAKRSLPDAPENKQVLDLETLGWTLQNDDLIRRFKASNMTIYNWRMRKGLPYCEIPTTSGKCGPVRFNEQEVREWADARGITFYSDSELEKEAV